jgi:hypothetical protein
MLNRSPRVSTCVGGRQGVQVCVGGSCWVTAHWRLQLPFGVQLCVHLVSASASASAPLPSTHRVDADRWVAAVVEEVARLVNDVLPPPLILRGRNPVAACVGVGVGVWKQQAQQQTKQQTQGSATGALPWWRCHGRGAHTQHTVATRPRQLPSPMPCRAHLVCVRRQSLRAPRR